MNIIQYEIVGNVVFFLDQEIGLIVFGYNIMSYKVFIKFLGTTGFSFNQTGFTVFNNNVFALDEFSNVNIAVSSKDSVHLYSYNLYGQKFIEVNQFKLGTTSEDQETQM